MTEPRPSYRNGPFTVFAGPNAGSQPYRHCAIDWPDFSEDGGPVHLDTCRLMYDGDSWCTCGLSILEAHNAQAPGIFSWARKGNHEDA